MNINRYLHRNGTLQARIVGYFIALVVVALVTFLKFMIPGIGAGTPTLLYLSAVTFLAYTSGTGPAVFALGLSAIIFQTIFRHPIASLVINTSSIIQVGVFLLNGLVVIGLVSRLRKTDAQLRRRNKDLLETNNQVTSLMSKALDTSFDRKRIDRG